MSALTSVKAGPRARRRIKQLEVMVADAIPETADTTTLLLFAGNDQLEYEAGHFLTVDPHQFGALERFIAFFEDAKGRREPPRAYSLASAPHERYLAITVKEEQYVPGLTRFPPLLSPLLVRRTVRGMKLVVTGFTGPYTLPDDIEAKTDHLVHLCAGSGGVPNFALLKHALEHHPKLRHTWVYSNRTWADVIFGRQLDDLERRHPDRLRVFHALTRESDAAARGPRVRAGRVGARLLREVLPDPTACIVYACGPAVGPWEKKAAREMGVDPAPRFLESCLAALHEVGVSDDRIESESYG